MTTTMQRSSEDLEMWNDSFYSDQETLIEWMLKDAPETSLHPQDSLAACCSSCSLDQNGSCCCDIDMFGTSSKSAECCVSNADLAPEMCSSPVSPEEEFMMSMDELKIMDDENCVPNLVDLPVHEQFMAASMNLVEYTKRSQESRDSLRQLLKFKENTAVEESREKLQQYLSTVFYFGPEPKKETTAGTEESTAMDMEVEPEAAGSA